MQHLDVTDQVAFGPVDGEFLPIIQCVCGRKWPLWRRTICVYADADYLEPCPQCGRRLFFRLAVKVYEFRDGNEDGEEAQ